jgi:hypothetical protein
MTQVAHKFGVTIINQNPHISKPSHRQHAEHFWLPVLLAMRNLIIQETGYDWHVTSYWRDSPSHHKGCSIDIAPDIANKAKHLYAVYRGSDPILYKRKLLIRDLQRAVKRFYNPNFSIGVYIESDHLHMQVYPFADAMGRGRLYKWGLPKTTYKDTFERSKLPLIESYMI